MMAKKVGPDRLAGVVLCICGVGILLGGQSFPAMPEGHPGPGLFPSGIGILLVLCALYLIFLSRSKSKTSAPETSTSSPFRLLALLGAVAVFPLFYRMGNFFMALFITVGVVAILFEIKWWRGLLISGLTCAIIYLLFNQLLQVQL